MYDRAPRALTQPSVGTGHGVGPGTYEAPETIQRRYGKKNSFLTICWDFSLKKTYISSLNYFPNKQVEQNSLKIINFVGLFT